MVDIAKLLKNKITKKQPLFKGKGIVPLVLNTSAKKIENEARKDLGNFGKAGLKIAHRNLYYKQKIEADAREVGRKARRKRILGF